jgi:ABC-2 type transport system permease protein
MNSLAGTGTLIRLILRRDRIALPIWIVLVALVPIGVATTFAALYPTPQALQAYADLSMSTPATVGVLGFVYSPTVGGLTAWRTGLNSAFLIVPVSILLIIRHTRTEEEVGRRELLGSTVVGRLAPLSAALIVVLGANLLIAALIAGGLIGVGLPPAGSIVLGLSAASAGWIFAALAGLVAQLTESPGAARGMTLTLFGLSWLMRAVGDLGADSAGRAWLSWLSPLGWVRLTRAYADERWWVFALALGPVVVFSTAAYILCARRDLGAGLLPQRAGPAIAAPGLRDPLALAWRLHRGTLLAWTAGAAVFGSLLGAVAQSISKFVDAPQLQDWAIRMGAHAAGDAFLFMLMYVLGQVVSAYAIAATLRMWSEEIDGRADPVLATQVSRLRWAGSHLFFAAAGPTVMLAMFGFTVGLGYGLSAGDTAHELPRLLARSMVTLPAVWVMAGLAAALYGLLPRFAAPVAWGLLAVFLALELGWELQQVSQSVFNISPFAHVHWAIQVTSTPLIALVVVAAVLTSIGVIGLYRRDIG